MRWRELSLIWFHRNDYSAISHHIYPWACHQAPELASETSVRLDLGLDDRVEETPVA